MKYHVSFFLFSFLLGAFESFGAVEKSKVVFAFDRGTGKVEFAAIGRPSALKVNGTGALLTGSLEVEGGMASGTFSVDLQEFGTGIQLRDRHMKEKYLETTKFPRATLRFTRWALGDAAGNVIGGSLSRAEKVPFEGTLSLHGVERRVSGIAGLVRSDQGIGVDASFAIRISDFGIITPSFAGITVADEVTVHVQSLAEVTKSRE